VKIPPRILLDLLLSLILEREFVEFSTIRTDFMKFNVNFRYIWILKNQKKLKVDFLQNSKIVD
jgi:hypothetical protein